MSKTSETQPPKKPFSWASLMPKKGTINIGTTTLSSGVPGPTMVLKNGVLVPAG